MNNPAKELQHKAVNNRMYRIVECYTSDIEPRNIHILGYEVQTLSKVNGKWYAIAFTGSRSSALTCFDQIGQS